MLFSWLSFSSIDVYIEDLSQFSKPMVTFFVICGLRMLSIFATGITQPYSACISVFCLTTLLYSTASSDSIVFVVT